MSKSRGQTIGRAIRRGNATYYYDRVASGISVCFKKGCTKAFWKHALKNRCNPKEN
jgi:hypothetical protein